MKEFIFIIAFFFSITGLCQEAFEKERNNAQIKAVLLQKLNVSEDLLYNNEVIIGEIPNQKDNIIAIIPVINEEEDYGYTEIDAHILVVNKQTQEILHSYFKKNYWESNAIILGDINFYDTPLQVHNKNSVFGILTEYHASSSVAPYSTRVLSLFEINDTKKLKPILNYFDLEVYRGENNMHCGWNKNEASKIVVAEEQTFGYHNLVVNSQIALTVELPKPEKFDECEDSTVQKYSKKTKLIYDGTKYKVTETAIFEEESPCVERQIGFIKYESDILKTVSQRTYLHGAKETCDFSHSVLKETTYINSSRTEETFHKYNCDECVPEPCGKWTARNTAGELIEQVHGKCPEYNPNQKLLFWELDH